MRYLSSIVLLVCLMRATQAAELTWNLQRDFAGLSHKHNPNRDRFGNLVWHFLRTTRSVGPVPGRRWIRDGVYARLNHSSESLFQAPHDGWIFREQPTFLAPFVSQITRPYNVGINWKGGEIVVAPGPDHGVVVGWESPVSGLIRAEGRFDHAQTCCGVNSQVNWYVEYGGAPGKSPQKMTTLAQGVADLSTANRKTGFRIPSLRVRKGQFLYFIVDAKADGTVAPHHGDATQLSISIKANTSAKFALPEFEKDIRPILAANCFDCHGADTQEAGLDLRSVSAMIRGGESGPAILPGKPQRSYLLDLIRKKEMPPKDHKPLTYAQIAKIGLWLEMGAKSKEDLSGVRPRAMVTEKDRKFWAFQTPRKVQLPSVSPSGMARARTAIDRLVLQRLEAKGLSFSPDATRPKLIRRATIDLIGLPPSPREVSAFVQDKRPDAYERLIERLLASPHYGERWGRHWLDAAGYVDVRLFDGDFSTIYTNEGIWRYRDYVVAAHNSDMPWDRFIQEQLAGDEMVDWKSAKPWTPAVRDKVVATGFLRMIEDHTSEAQYGIKKRYEVVFDLMNMVSTSLLGLTMDCCRCHNHKFDPIPQRDYYRFMANFESAYNVRNWLKPQNRWIPDVGPHERGVIDAANAAINKKVAARSAQLKSAGKAGNKAKVAALTKEIQQLKRGLRSYGRIQALWDVDSGPDSRLLRRGNADRQGIAIDAGFPEILSAPNKTSAQAKPARPGSTGRRLALGRWLTERRHPLTARGIVNRVWQHHLGKAIVPTPDNFGRSGSPPTHPRLLDWLAVEFMENGWSLKHLHRLIMFSTVYRQQSQRPADENAKAERVDPTNTLLWRMNLQRLDAEIIRDAVLKVSGQLNRKQGGKPVGMDLQSNGLSMVKSSGNEQGRRSIYVLARRVYPLRFLEVFDSPIMPINCTRRPTSATVLQSFTFLNGPFVLDAARRIAADVKSKSPRSRKQIELAYQRVLCRPPRQIELNRCDQFLKLQSRVYTAKKQTDSSLVDLCHMLLCTNEFLYVD